MLNMKRLSFILCGILFFAVHMAAQNGAQISADELTYNFGTIAEADGLASHTFEIKNTGDGHSSSPVLQRLAVVRNRNGQKSRSLREKRAM